MAHDFFRVAEPRTNPDPVSNVESRPAILETKAIIRSECRACDGVFFSTLDTGLGFFNDKNRVP